MITEENYLSLTIEFLLMLQVHLEIAGTEYQRIELERLIKYLNKTN